jgi:hypothetical protein
MPPGALPVAVETAVRDEFGVCGYNLHLNCFLTPIPVYGRRIADRNNFSTGQIGQIGQIGRIYPICLICSIENKQQPQRLPSVSQCVE